MYPSLLPQDVQLHLLSKLFYRDACDPDHQTNVHVHYDVMYPPEGATYFDISAAKLVFQPKDATVHKPITTAQYLNKKLRWITLGGQYDWTEKVYPAGPPPPFPPDVKKLVEDLLPMKAEAAIVNLTPPAIHCPCTETSRKNATNRLSPSHLAAMASLSSALTGMAKIANPGLRH